MKFWQEKPQDMCFNSASGSVIWTLSCLWAWMEHIINIAWGRSSLPTEAIHTAITDFALSDIVKHCS